MIRRWLLPLTICVVTPLLLAEGITPTPLPPSASLADPAFIQWLVQQGGAYLIILILGYFFRRDYRERNGQLEQVAKMLVESTVAQTRMADVLATNTTVTNSLQDLIRTYLPRRPEA